MQYPLRFSRLSGRLMRPLGMGPGVSGVDVDAGQVRVRMGWAFRARFPSAVVREVRAGVRMPFPGWGVHGWRGRWLVNGSSRGLVRMRLDPPQRARVCGFPVRLRALWVSAEDPEGLARALGSR